MIERDIQRALTRPGRIFDYRRFLVIPNASWGVNLHECDLLALTEAGYAHEIEIKVTVSDLKRDEDKRHHHNSQKIKYLWFAAPEEMREAMIEHVPDGAGIILIRKHPRGFYIVVVERKPTPRSVRKFTDKERYQLARLGTIRYWSWAHGR